MDAEKLSVTPPGSPRMAFDPAKYPIDGTLKQALVADMGQFRSGSNMLYVMNSRRDRGGHFPLGLWVAATRIGRRALLPRHWVE